jgi:RNA polymerase sigma factor (sigma-70 family)
VVSSTLADVDDIDDGDDRFERYYRRAWRDAVRWATGLTGDVSAGEDVAQEAFARIRPRFGTLDNADGYLRTTIVNVARDSRRAEQRRNVRELRVVRPEQTIDPGEREPQLLTALSRLPYDQRATLVLRYWADWDEASIATALGCRPSTVRSHSRRGLAALRRSLDTEVGG